MERKKTETKQKDFVLPVSVVGSAELSGLLREMSDLEDFLVEAAVRKAGSSVVLPKTGRLAEVSKENGINLLDKDQRLELTAKLEEMQTKAPVIHISFASDPPLNFTYKLVQWFRTRIHPYALVQVGLQPTIAAGCVLRTPNKYFDMSLRQHLKSAYPSLLKWLEVPGETK